jgi:hypothetical protein
LGNRRGSSHREAEPQVGGANPTAPKQSAPQRGRLGRTGRTFVDVDHLEGLIWVPWTTSNN